MLPRERERIQNQLINWGYTPRMVEHMQPWILLSHYESEKKKREKVYKDDIIPTYGSPVKGLGKDDDGKYKGFKYK